MKITLLIKEPKGFKIKPKDIPLFLALGLVSILFFTCCYFTAIRLMTMSTAAILLYTSPIWVMILAIIFLKEKINPLIGSAGVSAVPMAARVSQTVGQKENPSNFLLMHAMGPNVAGVLGSAIAAGLLLSFLG